MRFTHINVILKIFQCFVIKLCYQSKSERECFQIYMEKGQDSADIKIVITEEKLEKQSIIKRTKTH